MKLYLTHALHYFIKIIVILALAFGLLYLLEGFMGGQKLLMGRDEMVYTLLHTPKGWIIIGLVVVLALIYPITSFTKIDIAGDLGREQGIMDRVMGELGFGLVHEDGGKREYKAKSFRKRLFSQFDNKVTVSGDGRYITISGMKKDVGRVEAWFMHYRKEGEE